MYQLRRDKIYATLQRGDSVLASVKHPNLRLWDGMVGYIDPMDWTEDVYVSDYWLGETCVVELDRGLKPTLVRASLPIGMESSGKNSRRTTSFVDFSEMSPLVLEQEPDFGTNIHVHKKKLPILDGSKFDFVGLLKDTTKSDFTKRSPIEDVGQITQGNYTVGPVGANYPTFGAAGGGFAALGNLTGNLTFTLIGAITETGSAAITESLNGFTFSVVSNNNHLGDPTAGYIISVNHQVTTFDLQEEGPGTVLFRYGYTRRIAANNANNRDFLTSFIAVGHDINLYDWLCDGNAKRLQTGVYINSANMNIMNCVFWDVNASAIYAPSQTASLIENIACYGCVTGFDLANQAHTVRNAVALSNTTDFANIGGATGRFCRDSDGTGANANWVAGAGCGTTTAALSWRSLVDTNTNFIDILEGGPLDAAGEANTLVRPVCIRGRTVPSSRGTSIGPAEVTSIFGGRRKQCYQPHIAIHSGIVLK